MTPAVNVARKAKIGYTIHEYEHDPAAESYGQEAADKLGIAAQQVFKTLVVMLDNKQLAVAVIPVCGMLSMKRIAASAGAKKAGMAAAADVQRSTGYILGGVSPLGQKKRLKTIIDVSAEGFKSIYVSAGRRGLEIELSPLDLQKLSRGTFADIQQ